MVAGVAYVDEVSAAYLPLARKYAADEAADQARREGLYVCTGGVVSASATQGKLDLAAGTDFAAPTELTYSGQSAQPGCLTAISTTVAAGSNGQTVSGLTSGQLVVAATAAYTASGLLAVIRSGSVISCIAYTSLVDGTHFGGVSLVSGWTNITFASATDTVVLINNDLTAFKWLNCEVDASGVYQTAVGSAGSTTTAVKPALTAARTMHASLLLQPVSGNTSALSIDALNTAANGKSKLVECRRLVTPHAPRIISVQSGGNNVTNPTSLTTLCTGAVATVSIPANSVSVGDIFDIDVLIYDTNNAATSAREYQVLFGAASVLDFTTTVSLVANAFGRLVHLKGKVIWTASGTVGSIGDFAISGPTLTGNTVAETARYSGGGSQAIATVAAVDVKGKYATSSTGATMKILLMTVTKMPV